jgi:hypothetical protein
MKAIKRATGAAMQRFFRWITSSVPREDRNAAAELAEITPGLKMHPAAAWRLGIVLLIGAIGFVIAIRGGSINLIGAVLGGGALAVAYVEWLLGRRESSMDKFYERLMIANDYRSAIAGPGELGISPDELYVFSELDNLEYVIERYRFGYMSAALALRGVRTFQSRLEDIKGFRELVPKELKDCGYSEHTCIVVLELINKRARLPSTVAQRRGKSKSAMR